ncbi:NADPH:quinone reductase [Modicisalibacter ilicicola DSM 19980]|uniref:NADPH:quinone reductase n=1 Tax=Modicisalibacter ilicicola DSM 19980 TaxID=1121942 RepID=A0A1M5EVY9_9GAMM|nr:NAD(P)-dependent alcohol dehydrogenase [Halomonas ilicicola]SHF83400.1 NADPH:quinone reductase [Halomonas ilicicola DSM 19980]
MQAYELTGVGFDTLIRTQRPRRSPAAHEVEIRVAASSINYRDYALVHGLYQRDLPKPFIPLSDGAGTVVSVGENVRRFKPGERVLGHYTTGWLDGPFSSDNHASKLGGPLDGWLADSIILPEQALLKVPKHLSLVEASTLPVSGLTAWAALGDIERLSGRRVLIEGTGSVSLMALQLAAAAGAETFVLSGKAQYHDRLRELGATRVFDYRQLDDVPATLLAATQGKGIDLAVEVVGGNHLLSTLSLMADGGTVAVVGFLEGFEVNGDLIGPLLRRLLTLRGVSVGSRAQFEDFLDFLTRHRIHPLVGTHYDFDSAPLAIEEAEGRAGLGKPVIVHDELTP